MIQINFQYKIDFNAKKKKKKKKDTKQIFLTKKI